MAAPRIELYVASRKLLLHHAKRDYVEVNYLPNSEGPDVYQHTKFKITQISQFRHLHMMFEINRNFLFQPCHMMFMINLDFLFQLCRMMFKNNWNSLCKLCHGCCSRRHIIGYPTAIAYSLDPVSELKKDDAPQILRGYKRTDRILFGATRASTFFKIYSLGREPSSSNLSVHGRQGAGTFIHMIVSSGISLDK